MRWRVSVELAGADGTLEVPEVGVGERPPADQQRKAPRFWTVSYRIRLISSARRICRLCGP